MPFSPLRLLLFILATAFLIALSRSRASEARSAPTANDVLASSTSCSGYCA